MNKIILNRLVEIRIDDYIQGNPYLVVAIGLCSLTVGLTASEFIKSNVESSSSPLKSVLVNVSGKLLMFQPEPESLLEIPEDLKKSKPVNYVLII